MKIGIRLMRVEDLPQVLEIEQSWDYLSKWGEEGYRTVLSDPRVYACLVAEDAEAEMPAENTVLRKGTGTDLGSEPRHTGSAPSSLSGKSLAPSLCPPPSQEITF